MIPRGSARTAGIPAGDAASIRAAIPAGPPSPQVACRRSDTDPPAGIRPQPPPPRLQPRKGNAERDDDNAVRALTTPTRNPNPGARAAGRNAGFLASAPVIGITCLDRCRFGTPDDPGHQAAPRRPGPATRPAASRYRAMTGPRWSTGTSTAWKASVRPLRLSSPLPAARRLRTPFGSSIGRYQMTAPADLGADDRRRPGRVHHHLCLLHHGIDQREHRPVIRR